MADNQPQVSATFQTFMAEAPQQGQAWMEAVMKLEEACALDWKTAELAYIAVLAALRMESGIAFHVSAAKRVGATRDEIISAVLVGLPAAGSTVTQVLPAALAAYDESPTEP